MKKVLLVILGMMLILGFSSSALYAEEMTQGEEKPAVEAGGYGAEKAAEAGEEEATAGKKEAEAGEEEAAEPAETESK